MIKINQLAGMNIHYLFYSLKEFFAYQQKIGISSVELWEVLRIFHRCFYWFCCKVLNLLSDKVE